MIGSPQMALLTPQLKENQMVQEIPTTKYPSITVKVMSCESKSVPFTFCNMKSNILDLKKKRGRKRKMISCNYEENTEGKILSYIVNVRHMSSSSMDIILDEVSLSMDDIHG